MTSGEQKIWENLADLEPDSVCKGAQAAYDSAKGLYTLKSFGWDIHISPEERNIFSEEPESGVLLQKLGEFSRLSILYYLVSARDIPLTGKLIRPDNLKGGHLFSRGTHVLPLDELSGNYGDDTGGFLQKGKALGSEELSYGDASVQLLPCPRIPVTLILWKGDNEYPARSDLLFDSSSEFQASIDILWSIAMMSVLILID
jgi:hypothetical protein